MTASPTPPTEGLTTLTPERVRELRDAASNITIQVNDNVRIGLGPMIRALCDAWLATHQPANVCPSCGGDMNAAPLPGCNRLGFDEDEV